MSDPSSGFRPHRAALILVLGILGIVMCFPLGIVAWVLGNGDLAAMDRGEVDPEGRGMTQAGKVLGIVGVALASIGVIIGIAAIGFGACTAIVAGR